MAIPNSLVLPLRSALSSQGIPGAAINDAGEIDPLALLGGAFQKITVTSRLLPPVQLSTQALSGPTGFWTRLVQPSIVLEGKSGRFVYSPAGEAGQNQGWLWATALVLGLVGIGYAIGRSKR